MSEDQDLPPVSIEFLIISYKTQAEMNLGLLKLSEDQPPSDIRLARHFIDILGLLQEKTKGNLVWEEERLLNNVLTELRFRYLQVFEEQKKKQAQEATPPPQEPQQTQA
jgi:Domain of unknown function (DUF1844)